MDLSKLREPFPPSDVEWRLQRVNVNGEKVTARCIAYITNRAIEERLDEVCTPGGWQNEFKPWELGTVGVLCGIGINVNGHWVWKWDGAEQPREKGGADAQPVAVKGGFSAAMKRAGAQWGIGRYLYDLAEGWAEIVKQGTPGARYGKGKDGTVFYWLPPKLPKWALPEGGDERQGTAEAPRAESAPREGRAASPSATPAQPSAARPSISPELLQRAKQTGMHPAHLVLLDQGQMPIGHSKGKPLASLELKDLESARKWCSENGGREKWAPLIDKLSELLTTAAGEPLPFDDPRIPPKEPQARARSGGKDDLPF